MRWRTSISSTSLLCIFRGVLMHKFTHSLFLLMLGLLIVTGADSHADETEGLRGDPDAISDAKAMVEAMGGLAIWRDTESVHFVHEWDIANRPDRYLEHEILDLTGPRSYVTMDSEIYSRMRAYSPEHGYWSITNGEFAWGSEESLANAMERAPYSIYRLARAVARDDHTLEVRYGTRDGLPGMPALEFADSDGEPRGWIVLNVRKEPVIWATTQYIYDFGPLARFGNLKVPNWATTSEGLVRYEMVSLTGSPQRPELELFAPPE